MNFIPGQVVDGRGAPAFLSEPGQVRIDVPPLAAWASRGPRAERATLGIRCEHVHEEADGPLVGHVLTEEYLGSARHVHVQTQAGRLVMRAASGPSRARGSELRLRLDPAQISMFDAATEKRL
ncbi:MAG: TOBE domain-containing protein [Myxococcota bacterium]|nr:TOBE domain-containing protein [Myxococcota bacterium]